MKAYGLGESVLFPQLCPSHKNEGMNHLLDQLRLKHVPQGTTRQQLVDGALAAALGGFKKNPTKQKPHQNHLTKLAAVETLLDSLMSS